MLEAVKGIEFLKAELHELMLRYSQIGRSSDTGVTRLAASREDGEARDFLCYWFRRHNIEIQIDEVGNVFGVIDLKQGDGALYCGSHLDSQVNGGRFDGTYGVVAACLALRALREEVSQGRVRSSVRYLVVVNWTNEEGARFQPSLLGSSYFTGKIPLETALGYEDGDGISVGAALAAIGYAGGKSDLPEPRWYVETHVEQDSKLEDAGVSVGVVTECWRARKIHLQFLGQADHTGPTPMEKRRDALRAASLMIAAVSEHALSTDGQLYASVGRIVVEPNSPNVVPTSAAIWIELRSTSDQLLDTAEAWVKKKIEEVRDFTGCSDDVFDVVRREAEQFDPNGVALAKSALDQAGLEPVMLKTVAGHDAVAIQREYPSVLLFVPSVNGYSHSPEELTLDEDLENGLAGLIAVLTALVSEQDHGNTQTTSEAS